MEVVIGLALGAGVLLSKRGRSAVRSAIGWTARKSGSIASRVRSSLEDTKTVAREQYELGRVEAKTNAKTVEEAEAKPAPANGHPSPTP